MKCKPLYLGRNTVGDRYNDNEVFVFFGNSAFNEKQQQRMFPEFTPSFLKQTHSNSVHILNGPSVEISGDAQVTQSSLLALSIYTADCLPILIHDPVGKQVSAIHAGWRGIQSLIIKEAILKLKAIKPDNLKVWIGPHIKRHSFEVGLDVAESLQQSCPDQTQVVFDHPQNSQKKWVDLSLIAQKQLLSLGLRPDNIWLHETDTFGDSNYYSFRREGSTGRLISFIALLPVN